MDDETHQPLAERWTCREHRQLPKRYRDMLSEPPPALPPPSLPEDKTDSNEPHSPSQQSQALASLTDRQVLKSGQMGLAFFDNTLWLTSRTMVSLGLLYWS